MAHPDELIKSNPEASSITMTASKEIVRGYQHIFCFITVSSTIKYLYNGRAQSNIL